MLRAQGAVGGSVGVSLLVILCIFVYVTNKALLSLIIHFFSVPCSRAPLRGIEGGEGTVHSLTPPTIPAGPRLELSTFRLRVQISNH